MAVIDEAAETPTLVRSVVHVWLARPEEIRDQALVREYEQLLSDHETQRYERFWFERDRHLFLVARALLRTSLSRYADVPARAWEFETNAYGRPEIVAAPDVPPLRFNVSHTPALVAVAITLDDDVGVDVEHTVRRRDPIHLAPRFFSATEVAALDALPDDTRRGRFFDLWTLKEAYIKARGLGLALPLSAFSFTFDEARVRIAFDPRIDDAPEDWSFVLLRPSPTHRAALAHRSRTSTVMFGECVPLRSAKRIEPAVLAAST